MEDLQLDPLAINTLLLACCNIIATPLLPNNNNNNDNSNNNNIPLDKNDDTPIYEDIVKTMHLNSTITRSLQMKRDWVRFITCCRMCIVHLCHIK